MFFSLLKRDRETDGRMDGQTDGRTDGQTDRGTYRSGAHLKNIRDCPLVAPEKVKPPENNP